MDDLWKKHPEIVHHFGQKWMDNPQNSGHYLFKRCDETQFLKDLNEYLKDVDVKRRTTDQLHDKEQFWNIYYEFEIAYFLRKLGLKPKLHKKIQGREIDIFLEEQKVVLEITHLNIPEKVKSKIARFDPKSKRHIISECFDLTFLNMERMKRYLDEKKFQTIYPNIVCFCPDIASGQCYDLENLVESKDYRIPEEIYALALWKFKKILLPN